jgi:glycosyltransferase involved in cell wall biosynthesis
MKILVINYEYPPIGGGGGEVSQSLAESYAKRGHDVAVLTAHCKGLAFREKSAENLLIHRISCFRNAPEHCTPLRMLAFMILGIPRVLMIARQFKPDVAHCHFAIPVGPLGLTADILGGIPYILTLHGGDVPGFVPEQTDIYFKLIMPLANWTVRRAIHVVAVGEELRQLAIRKFHRSDILYIPNGVDVDIFKPVGDKREKDCVHIVFAGRFNPQKGLSRLIRAVHHLLQRGIHNFRVDLFGGGPLESDLRILTRDLNVESHIHFRGWIKREDLAVRLGMADIFILPSDVEGMPVACLQAMASGLAIVGSRIMGIREVVQERENGILVEKGDIPGLADGLEQLINNKELMLNMGKRSRSIANEKYRWDIISQQYLDLMQGK